MAAHTESGSNKAPRVGICAYQSPDALLTLDAVAEEFGFTRRTLVKLRDGGGGPASFKIGGEAWYRRGDVATWCGRLGIPVQPRQWPTAASGTIDCEPWCKYGDGHPETAFREDQRCYSADLRIDLTTHLPVEESRCDEHAGDWVPGPDYLTVFAVKTPDEPSRLCISITDADDAYLTVEEAQQLMEALGLVLGQVAG